jgi:hypothetical protein
MKFLIIQIVHPSVTSSLFMGQNLFLLKRSFVMVKGIGLASREM